MIQSNFYQIIKKQNLKNKKEFNNIKILIKRFDKMALNL